jgi:geranylgeranyl diphosphate synthase type I
MAKKRLANDAKSKLDSFVRKIDSRLKAYWDEEISKNFGYNNSQKDLVKKMLFHAEEHNLRAAKRLRASFVYYAYLLGKPSVDEKIWKAAEAVELVHTALLMHDDFMDMDEIRRGKPTTQKFFAEGDSHYGDCMAVNLGDAVLCLGFERLLNCGFDNKRTNVAMEKMLRGITNTAYGQAYDVSLPKLGDLTEERVLSLHRAKTAIYTYENPLFIGAILAGLGEETLKILGNYSVDGGVAFQLQDDVLGVFGNEEKTGKSANSDLLQGKVTLLAVKTLELGNPKQKEDFLKVWGKPGSSVSDIEEAKKAVYESGAYVYSVEVAKKLARRAAETASKLRSLELNKEAVDYLEGIALYMVEREV